MKKILAFSFCALLVSCVKFSEKESETIETQQDTISVDTIAHAGFFAAGFRADTPEQEPKFASFGDKITAKNALSAPAMLKRYKAMKAGDTVSVKFRSTISSVCKKKGCWMKMDLPEGNESFVKFKDYAFFVPLNADKSNAIISGKAYVDVISVTELQHYAKDAGKSADEIAKITSPKVTYAFMADGVLLQQ